MHNSDSKGTPTKKYNFGEYAYEYEFDTFYCYPESSVLRNKLGITNAEVFFKAEREITSLRTAQALSESIIGNFDFAHLQKIHKFLFGDIYDWAGKIRTVNISKGNLFCQTEFIMQELDRIFLELKKEKYLKGIVELPKMAERLSYYLGELNAVHPFREGNGRTQRLFVTFLAQKNGFSLDFSLVTKDEMISASDESFCGHYEKMNALILKSLRKN